MHAAIPFVSASRVQRVITHKQQARSVAIKAGLQLAGTSTPEDDKPYLSASACLITDNIRSRRWTALRVMQAYVRSAARAHAVTNCLTEVMFERALADARKLDEELAIDPSKRFEERLLLGLPMSLKDENDVEGVDSTIGFTK